MATRKKRYPYGGQEDRASESRSSSFQHPKESKKSRDLAMQIPDYINSYVCPNCKYFYDFHLSSSNMYVGRVPLLLSCNHTLCEQCILSSVLKQRLECIVCNAVTGFGIEASKLKIQDMFPVNFYVFGMILYYKRTKVPMPNLSFRVSTENKKSEMVSCAVAMRCSQLKCEKTAVLKCLDCNEIYCDDCTKFLHDPTKISIEHDYVTLRNVTPEVLQQCQTHRGGVLEFACRPCNESLCCYCVLLNHRNHDYYQITALSGDDKTQMENLVLEAENHLRYLERTDEQITLHLNQTTDSPKSSLNGEISRHFENFHAKLQTIEKRLFEELNGHRSAKKRLLLSLKEQVNQNVVNINKLYKCAKQLLNKEDVKYNVQYILENLTLALKTQCHLLRQEVGDELDFRFEYGNAINDIDDNYMVSSDEKREFILVKTADLPEDYNLFDSAVDSSSNTSLTNDDNTDTNLSNTNFERWSEGVTMNRSSSLIRCNESIASDKINDKKSSDMSTKPEKSTSWADECSVLETELAKEEEKLSFAFKNAPELEINNKQMVTVTHINSPSSFYVHLVKFAGVMAELSKAIRKYSMTSCMKVQPELNEIYLVKFNDGLSTQWYRGRVTNIDISTNKYTVFFIDYGNTSVVSKNWIRRIPAKLAQTPPLAMECKIYDLYPSGDCWDKNALTSMADIVDKETLLMVVIDKSLGEYTVDLITLDGLTSVRDALLFSGVALPILNSNNLIAETQKEMASFSTRKEIHKFSRKFAEKETCNVFITVVENPFKIHLISIESQKILSDMKANMNNFYNGIKKGLVYSLEVGMFVAVLYPFRSTSSWFRAMVLEVPGTRGLVKVHLIDLGPSVEVLWDNIRRLDDKFFIMESLSFPAVMADVQPCCEEAGWPPHIQEFFEPYIRDEIGLEMFVCSCQNPPIVVLIQDMESYKMCVNGLLVSKKYGVAAGKYAKDIKWETCVEPNFTTEMLKMIQSSSAIQDESFNFDYNGIEREVEVVSAVNPSCIYVKYLDTIKRYGELHAQMQICYANCEFGHQKWSPKQSVVVEYNDEYLRGIVEEEVSPDVYKVNLKDVLKVVEVKASDMTKLHQSFTKCPELITRCHLANIIPAGGSDKWTAIACELLQETLKDKFKISLTKCGTIDMTTRSLPVLMWYKKLVAGGPLEQSKTILCSINKILLTNGVALKANVNKVLQKEIVRENSIEKKFWDWFPPTLITEDHILAIPTYVNDHGLIYIHDKRDEEQLTEISQKLSKHFENSDVDNKLEDWHIGDICIAKYMLTNQWYRAKVVGVNENSVNVVMVDYGNEEDLQPCDLRKEILFENIPVFSLIVFLQDINPLNGEWNTDDLDVLHGSIVDKEIDVYFVNGHDVYNPSLVYMSYKNISINEFMLSNCKHLENAIEGNNSFEDGTIKEPLETTQASVILDSGSDQSSDVLILDDDKPIFSYKTDILPTNKDLEIVIINLLEYNVIVFELTNYDNMNIDEFDKIQDDIQKEAPELPPLTHIELDAPCIVKYTQDDSYYRGKILVVRKDDVLVWFVDYGNFEFIPNQEVREMKPQWLDYPVQHYIAEIDAIKLVDETQENTVKERLTRFYNTMLIATVVAQEPLRVKLFDANTRQLIYQEFIDSGILRLIEN